jgi:type II secretory pathway predicted ATPase ExeA/cell division septation protein DedD
MNQWKGYGPDSELRSEVTVDSGTASQGAVAGTLTYEPYYGLRAKPFSLSTDPRALYKSSSHAAVYEDLLAAIRRREGVIVLTGEMGTGKTTLCRAALYQLDRKTFTTFVPDPDLSREDLLRMLLVGFGEVSVHDLKQGRLKGTPRAELGCQLYDFLISLESVDAFAALVIDEAQNLSGPLLDEIRALSEMEAGRRLLQIVLVGQPELRARLRTPEMQQIAQHVTTVRELRPLTREGVDGYVSHRLAVAGGARDRVEFSPPALDLVFVASAGIPRLVNRICDRALFNGYIDRSAQIGQIHVGRALQDLELTPPRHQPSIPMPPPVASPQVVTSPVVAPSPAAAPTGGLFVKTSAENTSSTTGDLKALLDLPPVTRRPVEPSTAPRIGAPVRNSRAAGRRPWWRRLAKALSVPALGMGVMLLAGSAAAAKMGSASVELPAVPPSPLHLEPPLPRVMPVPQNVTPPSAPATHAASPREQTWVVQIAAFSNPERSVAMVQRLTDGGWPAYQVEPDKTTRGLTLVRIGPFRSAQEADEVREVLRATADYEGAFVRNISQR